MTSYALCGTAPVKGRQHSTVTPYAYDPNLNAPGIDPGVSEMTHTHIYKSPTRYAFKTIPRLGFAPKALRPYRSVVKVGSEREYLPL